jgi:hypothetical protein
MDKTAFSLCRTAICCKCSFYSSHKLATAPCRLLSLQPIVLNNVAIARSTQLAVAFSAHLSIVNL